MRVSGPKAALFLAGLAGLATGEDVVHVGVVANAVHAAALFGKSIVPGDEVADTVAGIDGELAAFGLGAEVSAPGAVASAGGGGEFLTVIAGAGEEEGHGLLLLLLAIHRGRDPDSGWRSHGWPYPVAARS
jgi:hypothetical protein